MKTTKLLVLTAMSALLIVGCNSKAKEGSLPSGGKSVDVNTEDGQATLKSKLTATVEAYKNLKLDSASLTASASDVNAKVNAKATIEDVGDINLNLDVKDFGAQLEAKAERHVKGEGEEYDSLNASIVAKTTAGSLSLKGSMPGSEEGKTANLDASMSLKGAEIGAYLSGSKLYANYVNSGNEKLIGDADKFANTLLDQLKESMFGPLLPYLLASDDYKDIYDAKTGKFIIADKYAEAAKDGNVYLDLGSPVEFPAINIDQESEDYKNFIDSILELAGQGVGFQFKTYSGNAYGFALSMDKNALKNFIAAESEEDSKETLEQIEKYVSKFSFNADIYFGKDALLESAGLSFNVEAKLDKEILGDYSEMFSTFEANISASGKAKLEAKYNSTHIEFPSFDGYKKIKLFGN